MIHNSTVLAKIRRNKRISDGLSHWLGQRISALALIPFSTWFLIEMARHSQASYKTVHEWVAQPWIGISLAFFLTLIFYHNALGLRTIIDDYVPGKILRKILVMKVFVFSAGLGILSWSIILYIIIAGQKAVL
jgi:succinate dehydrogenase / fumarate reductase membrane anchor subunit